MDVSRAPCGVAMFELVARHPKPRQGTDPRTRSVTVTHSQHMNGRTFRVRIQRAFSSWPGWKKKRNYLKNSRKPLRSSYSWCMESDTQLHRNGGRTIFFPRRLELCSSVTPTNMVSWADRSRAGSKTCTVQCSRGSKRLCIPQAQIDQARPGKYAEGSSKEERQCAVLLCSVRLPNDPRSAHGHQATLCDACDSQRNWVSGAMRQWIGPRTKAREVLPSVSSSWWIPGQRKPRGGAAWVRIPASTPCQRRPKNLRRVSVCDGGEFTPRVCTHHTQLRSINRFDWVYREWHNNWEKWKGIEPCRRGSHRQPFVRAAVQNDEFVTSVACVFPHKCPSTVRSKQANYCHSLLNACSKSSAKACVFVTWRSGGAPVTCLPLHFYVQTGFRQECAISLSQKLLQKEKENVREVALGG